MSQQPYHYIDSGLDWVYLKNGFKVHDTPYGRGVAIEDIDGLHGAIARHIILSQGRIGGQEVKFLRSLLDVSQGGLADILGTTRASVARWEAQPLKAIPPSPDRALRMFFALKMDGNDIAERILALLTEIDEIQHKLQTFQEQRGKWQRVVEQRAA